METGYPLGWHRCPSIEYTWETAEMYEEYGVKMRNGIRDYDSAYRAQQEMMKNKFSEQDKAWYKPLWNGSV